MIERIDHVSIAVKDYEKARAFFQDILGAVPGAGAADDSMKYFWQIFSLGDLSRIELITPTGKGSFLDGFLSDRDGGAHHITLQTPDIRAAKRRLEEKGVPCFGFREYGDFWKEIFIHPRDAFGVLIQIAQFNPDDWLSDKVRFSGGKKWELRRDGGMIEVNFANPGGGKVALRLSPEEAGILAGELQSHVKI
jgi:methylmalonyl-CoA/ethylmalonyl-CoA epimerase